MRRHIKMSSLRKKVNEVYSSHKGALEINAYESWNRDRLIMELENILKDLGEALK
jgi:hypothetical protein